MSGFGTSMMYAQQMPAFEARGACEGAKTNSTPDSPPHKDAPDLRKLCDFKKSVIRNLPKTCSHCGAALTANGCVELKDGDIMAYCKAPGACGKSLVLFSCVDFSYPIYEKFCCFKKKEEAPGAIPLAETAEMILPTPDQLVLGTQEQMQYVPVQVVPERYRQMDVYALHGIVPPNAVCALCDKIYSTHQTGCDQNGWAEVRRGHHSPPADWPVYNRTTGKWSPMD